MRLINTAPLNQDFMSKERRDFLRNNLPAAEHIPVIGSDFQITITATTTSTVVIVVVVTIVVTYMNHEVNIQV